ncbi:hypothetical protein [Tessaracoccus sp. MC1756]|uniref:hypothetical protein n=1 Tax=Tessaracoccus sp. MC1756 TaxID=2760311 RepID=UPI001601325D|nr:hypothetical protein [Tessaracoccus sp. MC1756]MBB1510439.1 hypothetical protein [Tessaracoccus sp. MC1756]
MVRRSWGWVLTVALAVAVVSLVSGLATQTELNGDANGLLATRLTFTKLLNTGTAWAGVLILAGRLVRRPRQAAAAGVLSGWLLLGAHYGLGQVLGVYTGDIWAENLNWFLLTGAIGAPLGLIGAAAGRPGGWGAAARLAVPAGAVIEPSYRGMFDLPDATPWPGMLSNVLCGATLLVLGGAGLVAALRRGGRAVRVLDSAA